MATKEGSDFIIKFIAKNMPAKILDLCFLVTKTY